MSESFELDDIFAKRTVKPDPLQPPELYLLYSGAGSGKGLVYGTKVYTPEGYENVENLQVGDFVIGSDGKPTRVYGIWDRGELPVYTVRFLDGSIITTDGDHLWAVYDDEGNELVANTHTLKNIFESKPHYQGFVVPSISPVAHKQKANYGRCYEQGVSFGQQEISYIPWEIKYSSIADRQDFFTGVLDGVGVKFADAKPLSIVCENNMSMRTLAELARSLGHFCKCTHGGKVLDISPNKSNKIISVTPCGVGETRCLAVEAPDQLFAIDGYILTHNTHLASSAVDVSDDTKVLYIDVEGSTTGVVTNHKNWHNIDIDPVYQITATEKERENGITNEMKRFKYLRTLLSEKYLFSGKPTKYDFVVIDTLDVLQDHAIEYFMANAPVAQSGEIDTWKAWGNVKEWTLGVARGMKSMKPVGILVQHDREEKTASGAVVQKLALSGKARDLLPGIPDVVIYLDRKLVGGDEVTIGYFATDDGKVTKNRFGFPPKVKNPSIPNLLKHIDKKVKEQNGN